MVSPDGRWMAYLSNESGQVEIYVRPFPDVNGGKWKVSTSGGTMHRWSPDGRELYYWTSDALMVVAVESEPTFNAGTPEVLLQRTPVWSFSMGSAGISWDNHPDGKRFLMIKPAEATEDDSTQGKPRKFNVVVNWFEELKERIPGP
jgi:Tol biopolymer transport system component